MRAGKICSPRTDLHAGASRGASPAGQSFLLIAGMGNAEARKWVWSLVVKARLCFRLTLAIFAVLIWCLSAIGQSPDNSDKKLIWKPVSFAILKFNDEAPKSWNIYHAEKRGLLLVRLWKRFLFVNLTEQQVFDVDPGKVTAQGEDVQWSVSDLPEKPIDLSEWKERNVGLVERVRFRFGKEGHVLELQIPLRPDGKPMY